MKFVKGCVWRMLSRMHSKQWHVEKQFFIPALLSDEIVGRTMKNISSSHSDVDAPNFQLYFRKRGETNLRYFTTLNSSFSHLSLFFGAK